MKQRQRRIHCKHFNGVIHHQCKAGCAYVPGHIDQCIWRGVDATAPCPKLEYPTQAEIEISDRETREMLRKVDVARAAIVTHATDHPEDNTITCPVCGTGLLCYAVHSNGHVHAKCSTDGCVCWME